MAEPLPAPMDWDHPVAPDVSHLTTEDDEPVDNAFQDKQCDILTESLRVSWTEGRPFVSASNVAIFAMAKDPAIVPDLLLSCGVEPPSPCHAKENRSYYIWNYGKPPEVVIEVVSNAKGGEDTTKLSQYAQIKVPYYAIYDPDQHLSPRVLRIFQLVGLTYIEKVDRTFPELGLALTIWYGEFDGFIENWLRWATLDGKLLATGEEARLHAERESERAERESERAERAEQEAERLREKLKALGFDPHG